MRHRDCILYQRTFPVQAGQPWAVGPWGEDLWEGAVRLTRGGYHFNLLVDGSDWVVPYGVGTVSDGMGGMVAVLIVP